MTKYNFNITKIHCVKPTKGEWFEDEIYCAVVPAIGKIRDGFDKDDHISPEDIEGRILKGFVSDVKEDVDKNTAWKPKLARIEIDAHANEFVSFVLFLFEEDNGKLRKKLIEKFEKQSWPVMFKDDVNFSKILKKVIKGIKDSAANIAKASGTLGVALEIVKAVFKVAPTIIGELRKDDFIGSRVVAYDLRKEDSLLPREYEFRGDGAIYRVGVVLTKK